MLIAGVYCTLCRLLRSAFSPLLKTYIRRRAVIKLSSSQLDLWLMSAGRERALAELVKPALICKRGITGKPLRMGLFFCWSG